MESCPECPSIARIWRPEVRRSSRCGILSALDCSIQQTAVEAIDDAGRGIYEAAERSPTFVPGRTLGYARQTTAMNERLFAYIFLFSVVAVAATVCIAEAVRTPAISRSSVIARGIAAGLVAVFVLSMVVVTLESLLPELLLWHAILIAMSLIGAAIFVSVWRLRNSRAKQA